MAILAKVRRLALCLGLAAMLTGVGCGGGDDDEGDSGGEGDDGDGGSEGDGGDDGDDDGGDDGGGGSGGSDVVEPVCEGLDDCGALSISVDECIEELEDLREDLSSDERDDFDEEMEDCLSIELCDEFIECTGL